MRVGAIEIPESDLTWTAMRSSGPGGQNVNKVASKVELRFDLARTRALDAAVKARLAHLARHRLDGHGRVVITSQKTRDQGRNLADARAKLAALVERALVPPVPRRPTKPTRAAQERRLGQKKRRGAHKRERRRTDED